MVRDYEFMFNILNDGLAACSGCRVLFVHHTELLFIILNTFGGLRSRVMQAVVS